MLYIYFFRHGEAVSNLRKETVWGRGTNFKIGLTDFGRRQIRCLAIRVLNEGIRFNKLYSSPLERCRESIEDLAVINKYPLDEILYEPKLLEKSQGDWEGMPKSIVYTSDVLEQISNNPDFAPPNGESHKDCANRIVNWMNSEIIPMYDLNKGKDINIGLMAHRMLIQSFYAKINKIDMREAPRINIDNASLHLFSYHESNWVVNLTNSIYHLNEGIIN